MYTCTDCEKIMCNEHTFLGHDCLERCSRCHASHNRARRGAPPPPPGGGGGPEGWKWRWWSRINSAPTFRAWLVEDKDPLDLLVAPFPKLISCRFRRQRDCVALVMVPILSINDSRDQRPYRGTRSNPTAFTQPAGNGQHTSHAFIPQPFHNRCIGKPTYHTWCIYPAHRLGGGRLLGISWWRRSARI